MLAAANGICGLYPGQITLGLSGGKDSRVMAAAFLATDKPVELGTHWTVEHIRDYLERAAHSLLNTFED